MLGIALAVGGAGLLAVGTQLQHRGVRGASGSPGSGRLLGAHRIGGVLRRPVWLLGTAAIGLAVLCQLAAINFSPLVVVQPLGVIALVLGAVLHARMSGRPLGRASIVAIALSTIGVGVFVAAAGAVSTESAITSQGLVVALALLVAAVATCIAAVTLARKKLSAIFYVCAAGVLYGFVAVCAKVVLARLPTDGIDRFTVAAAIGLAVALLLGLYFVQSAHAIGSPDLVIAGLTVVDPVVAIAVSMTLLGEGGGVVGADPLMVIAWVVSALVAILGVVMLARIPAGHEAQNRREERVAVASPH